MMLLAIDTSTEQASVALRDDEALRAEWSWTSGSNHSRHLHGVLKHLFTLESSSAASLTHLAVASGPGSFNGIRVGMSVAKGLAMAREIPLVGISTLDVIASTASWIDEEVWTCVMTGRDRVALAKYRGSGANSSRMGDYLLASPADAARLIPNGALLAGSGAKNVIVEMELIGKATRCVPAELRLRRAGYLAELGRRYFLGGGEDQVEHLEPLYLRRSAAEEKRASEGS